MRMRRTLVLLIVAGATLGSTACGAKRLPSPPYVGQPGSALVQVPYPPPPARVEFVPDKPDGDAVWIDGEWVWQGRRYAWKPGRWVKTPAGASFAPWQAVRDTMGTLYIAQGSWRDHGGNEIAPPPILRAGTPNASAVTDSEGETLTVPAIHPADAGTGAANGAATEETRSPPSLIPDAGEGGPATMETP